MEFQRMLLSNIKDRLSHGEKIKKTRLEDGKYIVQLTNGPEISFDAQYKPTVDNTIEKASQGTKENTIGNSTTLNETRSRIDI